MASYDATQHHGKDYCLLYDTVTQCSFSFASVASLKVHFMVLNFSHLFFRYSEYGSFSVNNIN